MDIIVTFFRDVLDGPIYIVVAIICGILFCACIGYLAEKSQLKRKEKEKYVQVGNESVSINSAVPAVSPTATTAPVSPQVVTMPNVPTTPVSSVPNPQAVSTLQASPAVPVTTSNAVQPVLQTATTTVVQPIPVETPPVLQPVVAQPIAVPSPPVANTAGTTSSVNQR